MFFPFGEGHRLRLFQVNLVERKCSSKDTWGRWAALLELFVLDVSHYSFQ